MAVRGQCCLRKLEGAAPANRAGCDPSTACRRSAVYGLRSAVCGLRRSLNRQPFLRRKFAACEVFVCCIILPIQGKASRLIRSEGRLR
ncbi:hypothetical protein EV673_2460 [Limnobacter thiooxidans]|nr:hypothetical protein EV673_2460 [Limnobacter thiooxidans]